MQSLSRDMRREYSWGTEMENGYRDAERNEDVSKREREEKNAERIL